MEHRGAPSNATARDGRSYRVVPDRGSARRRCLLTDLHPERGLSAILRQTLQSVLPDIEFLLEPGERLDAVWICGYEPSAVAHIREVRRQYPRSLLIVTSGHVSGTWEQDAIEAGADHALEWPCSMSSLSSLLSPSVAEGEIAN